MTIWTCLASRLCIRPALSLSRGRPFLSYSCLSPHPVTHRMGFSQLTFPTSGFESIDHSEKIEEETLPAYQAENYYPVQIGQALKDRYQIVGKVGYGVTSTVWLSRDLVESRHVVLKLYITQSTPNNEIKIFNHLKSVQPQSDRPGKNLYRKLHDWFEVVGPHGTHICLVQQPLGLSLDQMLDLRPTRTLTIPLLKPPLRQILIGVDFLHHANIVHTDLQSGNMILDIDDPNVFAIFEKAELSEPAPRKILKDRIIYKSRRIPRTPRLPIITDFGEARLIDESLKGDIMPDSYRAPEVILRMDWDNKVDIWSIGMVFWDLVAGGRLFKVRNEDRLLDDRVHLAEMIAIMGPPPKEFLQRSEISHVFWDDNGMRAHREQTGRIRSQWRGLAPIPDTSLEQRAESLEGEGRDGFLAFLRKILRWLPEERPTAEELVFDPWLMEGLKSRGSTAQ